MFRGAEDRPIDLPMEVTGILCAATAVLGQIDKAHDKPQGLYLKLAGMGVLQNDSDLQSVGGVPLNATLEFDAGFGVEAGIGYTFTWESPLSVSLELEYSYRSVNMNTLTAPGLSLPADGAYLSHGIMVDAVAAMDIGGGFGLYAGGGIGVTITQADLLLTVAPGVTLSFPTDEDLTFSWQAMCGAQYALGEHVVFFGGLKYFDAGNVGFQTFGGTNSSLALEVGLRVYF